MTHILSSGPRPFCYHDQGMFSSLMSFSDAHGRIQKAPIQNTKVRKHDLGTTMPRSRNAHIQIQAVQNTSIPISQSLPNVTNQFQHHADLRQAPHNLFQFTPSPVHARSPGATFQHPPQTERVAQPNNLNKPTTPDPRFRLPHDQPMTGSPLAMHSLHEVIDLTEERNEKGSVERLLGAGSLKRKAEDIDPLPKKMKIEEPIVEVPRASSLDSPVQTPSVQVSDHEQDKNEEEEEEDDNDDEQSTGEKVVSAVFEDDESDENKQWCRFCRCVSMFRVLFEFNHSFLIILILTKNRCRIRFERGHINDPVQPFVNASVDELLKHVQDDHPPSYAKLLHQLSDS
jgi:hypothetical protein